MINRKIIHIGSFFCGLFLLGSAANAAGFALQEQSVSGLGNAFAGGAAAMEDNSVIFTNPAALIDIDNPQLQVGVHAIFPDSKFANKGTTTLGIPTQGGTSQSDDGAIAPNIDYSHPLSDKWVIGLGVSAPFGLATEWGDQWVGRYVADFSELKDINIQPTLAYKINDQLSIGVGLDIAMVSAELTNAVDMGLVFLNAIQSGAIPMAAVPLSLLGDVQGNIGGSKYDGAFKVTGDGVAYGFNVGLLYKISDQTRFGIHYRSEIEAELDGDVDFTVGALEPFLGTVFPDGKGNVDINLPSTLNLSLFHQINDQWAIMGDAQYTGWSSFEYLTIEYENPTPPSTPIPELWNDVWRYSVGASYQVNSAMKLRAGYAFEETPVPSAEFRSPRIPDADRMWYTLGMEYVFSESLRLNAGAALITVNDPEINNSTHSAGQSLKGVIDAKVTIFSVSLVYDF